MENEKVYAMKFASVYPLLIAKAERKGRTREEVDAAASWLTGYTPAEIEALLEGDISYGDFFRQAPHMNEKRGLVGGQRLRREDRGDSRAPYAGHTPPR